jgi:hypothetical protein
VEGLFLNFIYSGMKYLKIFEGFGDDYYTEISVDDFYNMLKGEISPSSQLENIRLDYFERLKGYKTDMNIRLGWSSCISSTARADDSHGIRIILIKSSLGHYFDIYGFSDEWFLVYFVDWSLVNVPQKLRAATHCARVLCYKCDQFDGLVKLLSDKNIIRK